METQELINKLNDTQDAVRYAVAAIDDIKAKLGNTEDTPAPVAEAKPATAQAETFTLEQVRSTLAELSRKGYTDAVRDLLRKHGANKLSEVEPVRYEALMADAKEISHV